MMESMLFPDAIALSQTLGALLHQITWSMVNQAAVAVLGLLSVYFMTTHPPHQLASCVFGLASQPIWLYTTWKGEQYGFFLLATYYTYRYSHVLFVWAKKRVKLWPHS